MSQQNLGPGTTLRHAAILEGMKMIPNVETLAGGKDLDASAAPIQVLDPGGSGRNVDLPDVSASDYPEDGLVFIIINSADAAETLTIRDGANSDSTVDSVAQNGLGVFVWSQANGAWYGQGVAGS